MDEVLLAKAASIERCLARIRDEYAGTATSLSNITKQDAIVLNVQRACEAAIDGAMRRSSEAHGFLYMVARRPVARKAAPVLHSRA